MKIAKILPVILLFLSACSQLPSGQAFARNAAQPGRIQPRLAAFSAGCGIQGARPEADALAQLLKGQKACPQDVFEFRTLLQKSGGRLQTSLVANRGFHNPGQGSFSLFETVTGSLGGVDFTLGQGEFFFGHFTAPDEQGRLANDQNPARGSLMIELIAWDPRKQMFNFYELIGNGQHGTWFYRGDSLDIRADLAALHLQSDPARPQFGNRLRCSGCHLSGGPIMKELAEPHNDWWRPSRPLPLGGRQLAPELGPMLATLADAPMLASHVTAGLEKLNVSETFRSGSLQEQLRPLFCPEEVNFESDSVPLDEAGPSVNVPAAFLADPRLAQAPLAISTGTYKAILSQMRSRFPEIQRADGDHAWLAPVKARSDQLAVARLVQQGLIDQEFVANVLAVDMTRPVFSPGRCGLLRLVPVQRTLDWQVRFRQQLEQSPAPAARQLLDNLTLPQQIAAHQRQARRFLSACAEKLQQLEPARQLFLWLDHSRRAIAASEISANPRGQILEPGFRVIFPVLAQAPAPPAELTLDCQVR